MVIIILGGFLIWAGWTMEPEHAGGFAEAFALVREAVFGRVLLGILGFGFISYGIESLVEAAFRIVPARQGADTPTLTHRQQGARNSSAR